MTAQLPKFDTPPVVETVLSVQFAPLQKFTDAHAGWFWKNYLDSEWSDVQVAPKIDDQFELFGDEMRWGPTGAFRIATGPGSERIQLIRSDNERMIQIQDTRFIYNWKKQEGSYPSYDELLPEFQRVFTQFKNFTVEAGFGPLIPNQWEVTYVNHIPKGKLWESVKDWPTIFSALQAPGTNAFELSSEDFRGEWRSIIGGNLGRLYTTLSRGRVGSDKGPEIILLQFTARGPTNPEETTDLQNGFRLGHESIVLSFTEMTSDTAHKHWKRRA